MSFTRKIIDGAREGLNTVLDRIAADDTPLSYVDEDRLQSELDRRTAALEGDARSPLDNPRASLAGASAEARKRREDAARARGARIRGIRDKRAREAEKAQEEAFRRAREQARRTASSARTGGARSSGGGSRRSSGFPFGRQNDKIAEYYKVLDLPYGAQFAEVKKSYRALMRKYHPDRHVGNPKKQKAATELTMRVTQAYNALEEHLQGK